MRRRAERTATGNRVAELNYVIRFKPEYLDRVLSGKKNITLRLGIVRPRFGEIYIVCNDLVYGVAEIESLKLMRLEEITDEIAKREGFRSKEELIRELRKLYPEIRDTSYVTLIQFRVKEIFPRPRKLLDVIKQIRR